MDDELCIKLGIVPKDPIERRAFEAGLAQRRAEGGERAASLRAAEKWYRQSEERAKRQQERAARLRYETKSMDRDTSGTVIVHHYELVARLVNTTNKRLDDWYIELELPTPLLEPGTGYTTIVELRSDAIRSVFRTSTAFGALPSGDPYEWRLPYRVDKNLYWNQHEMVEKAEAKARVFVDGALVAGTTLTKIQNF